VSDIGGSNKGGFVPVTLQDSVNFSGLPIYAMAASNVPAVYRRSLSSRGAVVVFAPT